MKISEPTPKAEVILKKCYISSGIQIRCVTNDARSFIEQISTKYGNLYPDHRGYIILYVYPEYDRDHVMKYLVELCNEN